MNMYYYATIALIAAIVISISTMSRGTRSDFDDYTFVFGIPAFSLLAGAIWPITLFVMTVGLSVKFFYRRNMD